MRTHDLAGIRARTMGAGIPLIGDSPVFLELLRSVERVASHSAVTVLIRGETGTGKELVARAIHYLGARRDFPFVPINCGALPDLLAENELFGHRPGAYTGATDESVGLLRLAHRGTVFLDEVDSLPWKTQVALLRFLQDGRFRPLGSSKEEQVDVRIVAATNRCLEAEVQARRFREDLFFRLNLIALEVPPLRKRTGDVGVLSQHFLRECARRYQLPDKCLHEQSLRQLVNYAWPGNVRELENLIYRAYLLGDDEQLRITMPHVAADEPDVMGQTDAGDVGEFSYRWAKSCAVQEFDRIYLKRLIQRTEGNVTKAAQLAGKERRALGKLLKRYGIEYASETVGDRAS